MINLPLKNSEAIALHNLLELLSVLASDQLSDNHRLALIQGLAIDSNLHSVTPRLKASLDQLLRPEQEPGRRSIDTGTSPASIEEAIES